MQCIVLERPDKTLIYCWPVERYQEDLDAFMAKKLHAKYQGMPYAFVDEEDIAQYKVNEYHLDRLYFDGPCDVDNLRFDAEWDFCLMPPSVIRGKHRNRLRDNIQESLDSNVPDMLAIAQMQQDLLTCRAWTDQRCYEQALVNMDQDGYDKPFIRSKIAKKIQELDNA